MTIFRILKNFSKWLTNRKIWTNSYLDEVTPKKVRKSTEPKRSPFTNEGISSVLRAFKNDTFTPNKSAFKHSHYYPFIYFLFKTGVRNAEAIGLRVSSINLETNQICPFFLIFVVTSFMKETCLKILAGIGFILL